MCTKLNTIFIDNLAEEYNANLNMTMTQPNERWDVVYNSLRHFENGY